MIQTVAFCHKYYPMSRCDGYYQGYCRQCFKYDTVDIAVCDKCGYEIDDDEDTSFTSPHLCTKCRKELHHES